MSAPIYEFRAIEDRVEGRGWWLVAWRYAGHGVSNSTWETVARVFGQKRAEIVRDALAAEANERA